MVGFDRHVLVSQISSINFVINVTHEIIVYNMLPNKLLTVMRERLRFRFYKVEMWIQV